jgi:hypothetical protein
MERTSIWPAEDDREVFAAIPQMYGCASFSHPVRLAGCIA